MLQEQGKNWALYNGDCIEVLKDIPDNSIGYSIFSPPFASLYTYSDKIQDMGNSRNDEEFYEHFSYLIKELARVIAPGRNVSIHCMDIPAMKERDGYIGLKDFPGDIIRLFEKEGFIYHSRVAIWKDPLIEATRTKAIGLMHKQLCKDSALCRQGLPDYLITMRKYGENKNPVPHENGLYTFYGEDEPLAPKKLPSIRNSNIHKNISMYRSDPTYSHHVWRKYASPIWMDINQSNTLNREAAREQTDERHICPLQLDVIARGITLWSNPNDIIMSPFAGIGSEIYQAVKMKRRGIGIELKESYFKQAVKNVKQAEYESSLDENTLF
ncbi:DNA-methyltransferase [Pectinatus frisingensis]|uniref:DNA-methyltransferase n=1 Tax=Pectinatus frisingensis TaxID=865 RepID=UPI0018C6950D|nr:DNA methyltransferase [Pectinatus frisingensis]